MRGALAGPHARLAHRRFQLELGNLSAILDSPARHRTRGSPGPNGRALVGNCSQLRAAYDWEPSTHLFRRNRCSIA